MIALGSGDTVAKLFGWQGFRVVDVEIRKEPARSEPNRRIKVITLTNNGQVHPCRECGKRHHERRAGVYQESEPVRFRECSMGDFETYVEFYPWRVPCCGHSRREKVSFLMDEHRMTRRFFERVAALCTRLPVLEVAKMAKLSWDTVARVDKRAIEMGLGGREPVIENLRWVGIDEVSRTGGRVYFTVVTNLETGEVVHIGDGKGKKGLQSFLARLTKRERKRIRITSSDLGYLSLLQKAFAKAAHILDRFHIVKWVNDAIKELRRKLFGAAPRDVAGKELKVNQWLLLSGRERLEHAEKLLLARLMKLNRPLYRAYLLKEELRAILHHPWQYMGALRRNLGRWCNAVMRSRIEPLKEVARRLRPHFEAIVAAYQHTVKLGVVEEVNGKIVQLRRHAHGYRDREYFKLKIYQRCSLPSNPWAEIIL